MTKLPAGWRVENLGLIAAVNFTHTDGRTLMWCDNEWRLGTKHGSMPAPHFPPAQSMAEARRVGTDWLNLMETDRETDRND